MSSPEARHSVCVLDAVKKSHFVCFVCMFVCLFLCSCVLFVRLCCLVAGCCIKKAPFRGIMATVEKKGVHGMFFKKPQQS